MLNREFTTETHESIVKRLFLVFSEPHNLNIVIGDSEKSATCIQVKSEESCLVRYDFPIGSLVKFYVSFTKGGKLFIESVQLTSEEQANPIDGDTITLAIDAAERAIQEHYEAYIRE